MWLHISSWNKTNHITQKKYLIFSRIHESVKCAWVGLLRQFACLWKMLRCVCVCVWIMYFSSILVFCTVVTLSLQYNICILSYSYMEHSLYKLESTMVEILKITSVQWFHPMCYSILLFTRISWTQGK